MLSSLLLLGTLPSAGASCGESFLLGGACKPAEYKVLLQNSTAEECVKECNANNENGCCWHEPNDNGSCQFAPNAIAYEYGGTDVRSASNCTGGEEVLPTPQQLHIAFGATEDEMMVQWAVPTVSSYSAELRYGPRTDPPSQWKVVVPFYTTTGPGSYRQYRALLTNLTARSEYGYSVGWANSSIEVTSHFTVAPRNDLSFSPRIAMFGDIGWTDNQVLPLLAEESDAGAVDAMIIFGDFVYWDNGEHENAFMRDASRFSGNGSIPIMTTPGNGDESGNFSRYKTQFGMPGWEQTASLWHSFDIGRVHIAGVNTEALEHSSYEEMAAQMLDWLDADMKKANARRAEVPWIVVHFHRPAYTTGGSDAIPYEKLEPLMYKYGVDLVYAGHVHNQERTLPVYNKTVHSGPDPEHPYTDAKAPVYVVSGNPGNAEETNIFEKGFDPWTMWRSYHFGYSHMVVYNESVLGVDFVSTNQGGAVTDSFELTKTTTCNFGSLCTPQQPVPSTPSRSPSSEAAAKVQRDWQQRRGSVTPSPAQVAALISLYNSTNGANWTRHTNWLNGGNPCSPAAPWYGVSCNNVTERTLPNLAKYSGVTVVQLAANNLRGMIPDNFGPALSPTLQVLDLSSNLLQGTIPQNVLRGMPVLHTLYIEPKTDDAEFRLTGTLPADMGFRTGIPNLRYLGLNRNALTGGIPASLGNLSCHEKSASGDEHAADPTVTGQVACQFWVTKNNLTGTIPDELCDATFGEIYMGANPMECPKGSPPCLNYLYASLPDGCSSKCIPCKNQN